jgi:hypothetical protein
VVLAAQSGITISDYSVTPGAPSTVSFTVNWNKDKIDSAWVFVDYNDSGTMTRLPLSGVTASAGSAYMVSGNDQGAWVVADASGAFSATVQLVATCTDARPCVPTGACVYAIDYPPKAEYTAIDKIKFTGTPPFYLEFTDGSTPDTVAVKTQGSYTCNIGSKTLESFTDASGAPGVLKCAIPAAQTLTVSAAGYCADADGVLFALSGTQSGATYQLIKDNTIVAATLTTTEGPATFSGAHPSGTYSAITLAGAYCAAPMAGTHTVSVYAPGTDGQSSSPCSCTTGTTDCSGTCTTNSTYTLNDGACRRCGVAYVQQYDQCGIVVNSQYSTYTNNSCTSGCLTGTFTVSATGGLNTNYAASPKSWKIGSQTWSDNLTHAVCTIVSTVFASFEDAAEQCVRGTLTYYTWLCVRNNRSQICPTGLGWRVPTPNDVTTLISNLGGSPEEAGSYLVDTWGTCGYLTYPLLVYPESAGWIMAINLETLIYPYSYYYTDSSFGLYRLADEVALPVRCVK